jgi:GNAT superfamily N-acetyltransferase
MIRLSQRWLAEQDGELVGFAAAGPNDENDVDVPLKLYAVYVRKAYWGTGLGYRLMNQALGDEDAVLWVFRDNIRSREFYSRQGFVADGREQVEPEFGAPEIRMIRRRGEAL